MGWVFKHLSIDHFIICYMLYRTSSESGAKRNLIQCRLLLHFSIQAWQGLGQFVRDRITKRLSYLKHPSIFMCRRRYRLCFGIIIQEHNYAFDYTTSAYFMISNSNMRNWSMCGLLRMTRRNQGEHQHWWIHSGEYIIMKLGKAWHDPRERVKKTITLAALKQTSLYTGRNLLMYVCCF